MTKRILCLGDSNTYGFDPRDPLEKRYPPACRWTNILEELTGAQVVNMGQNGRTIPWRRQEVELTLGAIGKKLPLDLLIVMLGSNDALLMDEPRAEKIAGCMDAFLEKLRERFPELPLLLISPPLAEDLPFDGEIFARLAPCYRAVARRHGARFASAAAWPLPMSSDGVHFSEEAHRIFAEKLCALLEGDGESAEE